MAIFTIQDMVRNNSVNVEGGANNRFFTTNRNSLDRLRISTTDAGDAGGAVGGAAAARSNSSLTARMQEADAISTWCNSLPRAKVCTIFGIPKNTSF